MGKVNMKETDYYKSGRQKESMRNASRIAGELATLRAIEKDRIKREEYSLNPKICAECSQQHVFEKRDNKYCSSTCSARATNRNRPPRSVESKLKTSNTIKAKYKRFSNCKTCNIEIKRGRQYCDDPKCRIEQRSISGKKAVQNSKDNGNFKGWAARTKAPSYPEQYFIN